DFVVLPEDEAAPLAAADAPVLVEPASTEVSENDVEDVAEITVLDEEPPDFLVLPENEAPVESVGVPAPYETVPTSPKQDELAAACVEEELPDYLVLPDSHENLMGDDSPSQYPALPAPEPGLDATDDTDAALRLIRERFMV